MVVIIRHAEVDFCWSRRCASETFDSECRKYDLSPIKNVTYRIPQIAYQKIYVSKLSRSKDTAKLLFPSGEYLESPLLNEVPLKSSFDTKMYMPLWFWNLTGRLQWFINGIRQVETRRQTRKRAKEFAELIRNDDVDIAVVTHGYLLPTCKKSLQIMNVKPSLMNIMNGNGLFPHQSECIALSRPKNVK